jgi:hypothetical protein
MSLLRLQVAFSRIYLDEAIREAFRVGDRVRLTEFDLTESEIQKVHEFVSEREKELTLFTGYLQQKREQALGTFYPLLRAYMESNFWAYLCSLYVATEPVRSSLTRAEDAVRFARFVKNSHKVKLEDVLADILEFESTKAMVGAAFTSPPRLTNGSPPSVEQARPFLVPPSCLRKLRYDPEQLRLRVSEDSAQPLVSKAEPVHLLFFRNRANEVAVARLGPLLGVLLELATGEAPLSHIVEATVDRFDTQLTVQAAWISLAPLAAEGILGFV